MSDLAQNQIAPVLKLLPQAVSRLPLPVRFRAENALRGFEQAKVLLPIDREIASFRAITAVEEAASALIRSLQLRGYQGADLIDLKRHSHKAAVPFFLAAVRNELVSEGTLDLTIRLSIDPPKLTVALPIRQFVSVPDDMSDLRLELVDPLGFVGTKHEVRASDYFDGAVQKVAGSRRVDKLIAEEANSRNRILYAHDTGLPCSQATFESIEVRQRTGAVCLMLAIAVVQVKHKQDFAQQCLTGYLKVIGRTKVE
jgi:hypothetical protein